MSKQKNQQFKFTRES